MKSPAERNENAMDKIQEIAARIRELREVCGYTQEELAAALNIPLEIGRAHV